MYTCKIVQVPVQNYTGKETKFKLKMQIYTVCLNNMFGKIVVQYMEQTGQAQTL